jgi:Clp amino terminal domain, pathogenicity island component
MHSFSFHTVVSGRAFGNVFECKNGASSYIRAHASPIVTCPGSLGGKSPYVAGSISKRTGWSSEHSNGRRLPSRILAACETVAETEEDTEFDPLRTAFTENAEHTSALGYVEASRVGHRTLGTEHILLGVLRESMGIGAKALGNLGVNLFNGRYEVEKIYGWGKPTTMPEIHLSQEAIALTELVLEEARELGKEFVLFSFSFLADASTAISYICPGSFSLAFQNVPVADLWYDTSYVAGHEYIGTEHLLLGLLRCDGGAPRVLESLGLDFGNVRAEVQHLTGLMHSRCYWPKTHEEL